MKKNTFLLVLIVLWVLMISQSLALEVNHVYHNPDVFEPLNNEKVNIHFSLSEKAIVRINIYDDRDILIRRLIKKNVPAGDHFIVWDGKDIANKAVPPEAYRYTLVATNEGGKTVEHDITDLTGDKFLAIQDMKWLADHGQFEYTLIQPARVMIRVGLKNHGPLLANVHGWVPRLKGKQIEKWHGEDASNQLDLTNHPNMEINAQAFTLSKNTIFVGPRISNVEFIDIEWPKEKRKKKRIKGKKIAAAYQLDPETRGDYEAKIILPDHFPVSAENIPIVTGKVPVIVTVDQEHQSIAMNRRLESVFYIDGQFAFEHEVGFLPMTWILDTENLNQGEHYLTVNLRGYEGNFGLATTKVYVKKN